MNERASSSCRSTHGHEDWTNPVTAHMWTYKSFLSRFGFCWAWHRWRDMVCTRISSCICSPLCWFVKVIVGTSPFLQLVTSQLTSQAKFLQGETFAAGCWSANPCCHFWCIDIILSWCVHGVCVRVICVCSVIYWHVHIMTPFTRNG